MTKDGQLEYRIQKGSDPLKSGLERFESYRSRIGNVRILPDPLFARFLLFRDIAVGLEKGFGFNKENALGRHD